MIRDKYGPFLFQSHTSPARLNVARKNINLLQCDVFSLVYCKILSKKKNKIIQRQNLPSSLIS